MLDWKSTSRYTNSGSYPTERPKSGPKWSLVEINRYTHLIVSSNDFCKKYPRNVQWISLCTRRGKNETSSSQPSTSRYCRPWIVYLVSDKDMLHWHFTDSGLTVFNQPLADQDLSGLFLNLYPSGVEWILLLALRHLNTSSNITPFANWLFSLEHEKSYDYSNCFATTLSPLGQNTNTQKNP